MTKSFRFLGEAHSKVNLSKILYYRVGGPADILIVPRDVNDIRLVVHKAYSNSVPLTVLGAGTNVLVRDGGISGVVLYLGYGLEAQMEIVSQDEGSVRVRVPCFFPKAHLLDWSLNQSLGGLEFSAGIPGTLGGAVWMNAGTKWGSYSEVIRSVGFYHPAEGPFRKSIGDLGLKYRGHGEGLLDSYTVIEDVELELKRLNRDQLKKSLDLVNEILIYRGTRQDLDRPSCGSVFKNPVNSPRGSGRLIEATGLKGTRIGNAQISLKHANFFINLGNARGSDIEGLIDLAQKQVLQTHGVYLEPEVIILGNKGTRSEICIQGASLN